MHRDHSAAIWHYTFDALHPSALALLSAGTAGSDLAHGKAHQLVETLNQLDADLCRNDRITRAAMTEQIADPQTQMLDAARSMLARSRVWLLAKTLSEEASLATEQTAPARRKSTGAAHAAQRRTVI